MLLAAVAGAAPDPARPPSPPEGAPPILSDRVWAAVPALVEGHGLAMVADTSLVAGAPAWAAAALRDVAHRTASRAERLAADRRDLTAGLRGAGVRFEWLKGSWLAERGWLPKLRPMADLDLFAPGADLAGARGVLLGMGYTHVAVTPRHAVYLRAGNRRVVDARGEHPANPRPVELHGRVEERFRGIPLDLTAAWTPQTGAVAPGSVPVGPGATDALTHLSAHATVGALSRRLRAVQLLDLRDLAGRMDAAAWEDVLSGAATPGAARFVWPALAMARRHAGADVPDHVLARLAGLVRPDLRGWAAVVSVDAASRFGRPDTRRPLLEVLRLWPISLRELLTVWRFIVAPGPGVLAERDVGGSRRGPVAAYGAHAVYTWRVARRRWRLRA